MKTKKLKQIGNYKYKKHEKKKFGAHSKKKANYRAEKLEMKQLKKKLDKKDQKKKGKESADKPKVELPELSGKKLKNYKIAQKKKAKKEKEKLKKIEKREDAVLNAKDHVEFGEVVHGPPELTSRPRGMEAPVVSSVTFSKTTIYFDVLYLCMHLFQSKPVGVARTFPWSTGLDEKIPENLKNYVFRVNFSVMFSVKEVQLPQLSHWLPH